jgi:hypothetical protein
MMKNVIALGILVVLGAIAFFVFKEKPPAGEKTLDAAIKKVPLDRLDEIRILNRSETAGKAGDKGQINEIVLKKEDGAWRMKKPVDYKVNASAVERMTEALGELKVIDVIAENKSKHRELEVDDELGVEVWAFAGKDELAHLIVGASRNNMTFVRLPGKDAVYRIAGYHRSKFQKSALDLRDRAIVEIDKDSIKKITFLNKSGELALERRGEGKDAKFAPAGIELKNFKEREAENSARSLENLTAAEFVDEAPPAEQTGLNETADKVVVEATAGGKPATLTFTVGNEAKDKEQTYLKTSQSDQVFLVSKYSAKRLRGAKQDFEQTDEEAAKEQERKKKREEAANQARSGNPMPAMSGVPGGRQIPPEMMKKIREQLPK